MPAPIVNITVGQQAQSFPLSLDELWNLVQSKRGFESSPSPFKKDQGDHLRRTPATIDFDPLGRGSPLGDPVETFAGLQIIDKDGQRIAIGADFFDKGPLRNMEADKFDKHAEARVLRALDKAIPGEVPDGTLIGLVDQEVCPACRAKLEVFANKKKLHQVIVHVRERAKLNSELEMASAKTTSPTSLADLRDKRGNPIKTTYRESFNRVFRAPQPTGPTMPRPLLRSRIGAVGATIGEALAGLLLELLAAKVLEKINRKKFEERMRALEPRIAERKLEAYKSAGLKACDSLYYNIEIRVTNTATIYVAGAHSNTIPGTPRPEIQSIRISNQPLNSAGPLQETSKQPSPFDPVLLIEQTQVLTYSEPVTNFI
jgi:hypothetical protein